MSVSQGTAPGSTKRPRRGESTSRVSHFENPKKSKTADVCSETNVDSATHVIEKTGERVVVVDSTIKSGGWVKVRLVSGAKVWHCSLSNVSTASPPGRRNEKYPQQVSPCG